MWARATGGIRADVLLWGPISDHLQHPLLPRTQPSLRNCSPHVHSVGFAEYAWRVAGGVTCEGNAWAARGARRGVEKTATRNGKPWRCGPEVEFAFGLGVRAEGA